MTIASAQVCRTREVGDQWDTIAAPQGLIGPCSVPDLETATRWRCGLKCLLCNQEALSLDSVPHKLLGRHIPETPSPEGVETGLVGICWLPV